MDIMKSLFSLVNTNAGQFKSEKQAAFLSSFAVDGVITQIQTFTFGEYDVQTSRNTKRIVWDFVISSNGIEKVIKHTANGAVIHWENTAEHIQAVEAKNAAKAAKKARDQQAQSAFERKISTIQRIEQIEAAIIKLCMVPATHRQGTKANRVMSKLIAHAVKMKAKIA